MTVVPFHFEERPAMSQNNKPQGSIDAHAHWAPQGYIDYAKQQGGAISGGPIDPKMHDLEARLKWMDERNVKTHVLTLSGSMPWQWASQDAAVKFARIVNDAAVAAHQAHPDRFIAGAAIPMRAPKAALAELDRIAGAPGMRAVHLPNSVEGIDYLFTPAYEPFVARCEELGYPILFHPLDGQPNHYGGTERLAGADFIYNSLGFPFETATTAVKFILSGYLDKYPKLDVVLPHSGGCFPYIAGRVEHSIKKGAVAAAAKLKGSMRDYIRRFHYDTLAYYPETLRFMIELVGVDRVVIGTDNYAKMDVEQPNALVESLKLPEADLQKILRGNAAKLLRI
jgi:aminocarboxymuconate-semialdehyde decarboxylase